MKRKYSVMLHAPLHRAGTLASRLALGVALGSGLVGCDAPQGRDGGFDQRADDSYFGVVEGDGFEPGLRLALAGGELLDIPSTNLDSVRAAVQAAGQGADDLDVEFTGYFAIRTPGEYEFKLKEKKSTASLTLGGLSGEKIKISLTEGYHPFSIDYQDEPGKEGELKLEVKHKDSKSKWKDPVSIFARELLDEGSTTGGGEGSSTGDEDPTTGAGESSTGGDDPTPGDGEPPDYSDEAWCIGEDTDEPPTPEPLPYCGICLPGQDLRVEHWENDGPCLQAWSEVAFLDGDDPQCLAAQQAMGALCCEDSNNEHPVRTQCTQAMGPYEPVDLCDDGCFPSNPTTAGVYSLQAGGPLAPWVSSLGDRQGTCYGDDGQSPNALIWSCRRAYYLLKYGHLPPAQASEVVSWWSGHTALSANCGCDGDNTNNPYD